METGIIDKNGIEICVGDSVRKYNRLDNATIWEVTFGQIKANVNSSIKTIYTFILVSEEGYEDIMETEMHWQYSKDDKTEYEIVGE